MVNAGVLDHPVTGRPVVGLVARGGSRKLANLRARPQATIVVRAGWEWAAAEGPAGLAEAAGVVGAHDGNHLHVGAERSAEGLRDLLRRLQLVGVGLALTPPLWLSPALRHAPRCVALARARFHDPHRPSLRDSRASEAPARAVILGQQQRPAVALAQRPFLQQFDRLVG